MARSTRESILTAAAELMRHQGYAGVGMKDIAEASGAPIGSLYHHFRGGKVADRAGGAGQRGRGVRAAHPDDRRRVHRPRCGDRRRVRPGRRGHGGHRIRQHVSRRQCRRGGRRHRRRAPAGGAVDLRGLDRRRHRVLRRQGTRRRPRRATSRSALIGALEGGFLLARALRTTEPLAGGGAHTGSAVPRDRTPPALCRCGFVGCLPDSPRRPRRPCPDSSSGRTWDCRGGRSSASDRIARSPSAQSGDSGSPTSNGAMSPSPTSRVSTNPAGARSPRTSPSCRTAPQDRF